MKDKISATEKRRREIRIEQICSEIGYGIMEKYLDPVKNEEDDISGCEAVDYITALVNWYLEEEAKGFPDPWDYVLACCSYSGCDRVEDGKHINLEEKGWKYRLSADPVAFYWTCPECNKKGP